MVGSEVCEVYFRDIIACIRALFGDSDFAPYLVFIPEKHYTSDSRAVRMYHDMHTGKWWWSTQVSMGVEQHSTIILYQQHHLTHHLTHASSVRGTPL